MALTKRASLLLALLLPLMGCSIDSFIESKTIQPKKSTTFKVNSLGAGWTTLKDSLADLAYVSKKNGATISLDTTCEKYEDSPINQLMYNLLANLQNSKWEKDEYIKLDDREAYKVILNATADGVPIKAQAIVLRKNYCIYDFIFSGSPSGYKASLPDFEKFVGGFHAW